MRMEGRDWILVVFPFRFEFWDENLQDTGPSWPRRLMIQLGISSPLPTVEPSSQLRGVAFDIGRLLEEDTDIIGHKRAFRFTEAELLDDPKLHGLYSGDLRDLEINVAGECRRLGISDSHDWRVKLARHLSDVEQSLHFDEVCKANPSRSVSFDGGFIEIS